jgi:thiamine biosynthesis lipoprotein
MSAVASAQTSEALEQFDCFGGSCSVWVRGRGAAGSAPAAAERSKRRLLEWHRQFSRFDPSSELSRLNRDPRPCVPVSPMMARFVRAAARAAAISRGLVDPTLVGELERAGYATDLDDLPRPAEDAGYGTGHPRPASPSPAARWRQIVADEGRGTVSRPVGVQLDSGGVAKGLFGDMLASVLRWHEGFAINAAGDVVFGGTDGLVRRIDVASPVSGVVLHTFHLARGAVATSGVTNRRWIDGQGRLAHHLLDPFTGRPAFTGLVQVTALAPSGLEAEVLAKAALLAGPDRGPEWLRHGGVLVRDDLSFDVIEPRPGQALL